MPVVLGHSLRRIQEDRYLEYTAPGKQQLRTSAVRWASGRVGDPRRNTAGAGVMPVPVTVDLRSSPTVFERASITGRVHR
jgi:hypothetical protein